MKTIYNNHSNKSGVYKIVNLQKNRIYIGSTKTFKVRLHRHTYELRKGSHKNSFLQNDFNKCGEDAFEFHVIEVVAGPKHTRLLKEEEHIAKYYDDQELCYNLTKKAISREGVKDRDLKASFKRRSEASKKTMRDPKIRKRISDAHKKRLEDPKNHPMYGIKGKDNPRFGTKHTKEAKKKIAEASRGNKNCLGNPVSQEVRDKISKTLKGRRLSEETRQKMKGRTGSLNAFFGKSHSIETKKKKSKPIIAINIKTNKNQEFWGISEASRVLGIHKSSILRVLNGTFSKACGFKFIYLTQKI